MESRRGQRHLPTPGAAGPFPSLYWDKATGAGGAVGRRGVEPGKPFPAARIRMGGQEVESHFWLRYEHLPYCEVQG